MTRRNPFEELEQLFERMSRQVEGGDLPALGGADMSVDVLDRGDTLEVRADLPGFEREDIDLTLTDGTLTIEANRERDIEEHDDDDVRYYRRERRRTSASRSVRIPEAIDEDAASARYEGGVLTIALPKADPGAAGQQIDIE